MSALSTLAAARLIGKPLTELVEAPESYSDSFSATIGRWFPGFQATKMRIGVEIPGTVSLSLLRSSKAIARPMLAAIVDACAAHSNSEAHVAIDAMGLVTNADGSPSEPIDDSESPDLDLETALAHLGADRATLLQVFQALLHTWVRTFEDGCTESALACARTWDYAGGELVGARVSCNLAGRYSRDEILAMFDREVVGS